MVPEVLICWDFGLSTVENQNKINKKKSGYIWHEVLKASYDRQWQEHITEAFV